MGVRQVLGDLADADAVRQACIGQDAVLHNAAKAGAWGSRAAYWSAQRRPSKSRSGSAPSCSCAPPAATASRTCWRSALPRGREGGGTVIMPASLRPVDRVCPQTRKRRHWAGVLLNQGHVGLAPALGRSRPQQLPNGTG